MTFETFFFFLFSSIAFVSAILVILSKNSVHSVFFLIFVFINVTGLLLISKIEFLAIILIIIYVGAIAVLFLFVVMMLNVPVITPKKDEIAVFFPISLVILFLFSMETFLVIKNNFLYSDLYLYNNNIFITKRNLYLDNIDNITNIETLGQILYSYYAIFFLISGIILLIALIGAVVLTKKERIKTQQQYLFKQLSRNAKIITFKKNK